MSSLIELSDDAREEDDFFEEDAEHAQEEEDAEHAQEEEGAEQLDSRSEAHAQSLTLTTTSETIDVWDQLIKLCHCKAS